MEAPPAGTRRDLSRVPTFVVAGVLALCLVSVTHSAYQRVPFAVAACAALLAADTFVARGRRRRHLGQRGRSWLVAQALLLTLAGAAFLPVPNTRPSFYAVLGASAFAAAMYAVGKDTVMGARGY